MQKRAGKHIMRKASQNQLLSYLEQANQVATLDQLDKLLGGVLALLANTARARAGVLYLLDSDTNELACQAHWGDIQTKGLEAARMPAEAGSAGAALQQRTPLLLESLEAEPDWHAGVAILRQTAQSNVLSVPLFVPARSLGVVQLFDCEQPAPDMLNLLAGRMASEIDKMVRLDYARQHSDRLSAMIAIFEQIGSTLDRDKLLRMMIEYAREVIQAEACSLFLVDKETDENVLHMATNVNLQQGLKEVRVPPGKGIIGHVVNSGKPVLVSDVSHDERHYRQIDQSSGFVTRTVVAVPLRTRTLLLGEERGLISTHVIGGFEAINKQKGTFDDIDTKILGTLANQAATVLQIAELYRDANELFLDVIKALAASIDAKDPYTEGHSQRVSDFSVEIARQMGLPADMVHHVRIGSLLHDIGKIGIPDRILVKPGRLNDEEFHIMKQHPIIGANIMGQVHALHSELPALAEHHERLDGTGYPLGLKCDEISLFARIVSVADVFDAMTSDRPYRAGMPVEEVLDYLYQRVNTQFDPRCVDALAKGYTKGHIRTQHEREAYRSQPAQ